MTGREGKFHALAGRDYGTQVVAGVTPGKGGTDVEGIPVFNTVHEAVEKTGANASLIFVPPPVAADAIMEAADAGVALVIAHHRGDPGQRHDPGQGVPRRMPGRHALIGPNCPGVIRPSAKVKIGIMPARIHRPGKVGIVSRSGTLTYEAVGQTTALGLGQSTCVGIGGDPVNGTNFIDCLEMFEDDPETEAIIMIGEIGGSAEEEAAAWIAGEPEEAGRLLHRGPHRASGPPDGPRRGDHLRRQGDRDREDRRALRAAGVLVADSPALIGETLVKAIKG